MNVIEIGRQTCLRLLRKMLEIRLFQERVIQLYPTDVMVTPVHLHIGQEAVPVGCCAHLTDADSIFFTHRTHGPALAKGMSMRELMAELYGRTTGCSHSYGGSMHIIDPGHGMLGSSSIVGGGIALGVGSALAAKLSGEKRVAVSYFGDGATDCGAFWESLNFAALKQVPVLFLCEDNALSNVMPKSDHLYPDLCRTVSNFMTTASADGTDVTAVYAVVGEVLSDIRATSRPAFVQCKTKRWMKHQGVERDDLPYNPVDVEQDCPIRKLRQAMYDGQMLTPKEAEAITQEVRNQVDEANAFAINSPVPEPSELVSEV